MIVRALDDQGDWTFGRGKNDYLSQNDAVAQDIQTRLNSYLGDCFFDLNAGVDWFNLLGSKNIVGLNLALKTVILNTENVLGITELSLEIDSKRELTVTYEVQTSFLGFIRNKTGLLLTSSGDILTTDDDGQALHA
jgi:hypothetical protein